MLIKRLVIDGFKSYANRVTIEDWDKSFNAITGLNGSGKSNILDAICFVLGITNLSQVRARDLNDLIYKQGTTRVTKASVSLVFDNRDKSQSPVGYEDKDEFTITRQIAVNSRGKYLLDGHVVQQNKIQTLLQSVQLNVNNPHFLIMQGRVTKVCNMKPEELLGLLEESAGTRMYNQKRADAMTLLARKESKVKEVNDVLRNDVQKTMDKLRNEKANYVTFVSNATAIERLERFCAAAEYVSTTEELARLDDDVAENEQALRDADGKKYRITDEMNGLVFTISEREKSQRSQIDPEILNAQKTADAAAALTRQTLHNTREAIENNHKTVAKHNAEIAKGEALLASHAAEVALARGRHSDAEAAFRDAEERVESLRSSIVGLGMGGGPNAGSGSLPSQLMAAQSALAQTGTEIEAAKLRLRRAEADHKNALAQAAKEKQAYAALEKELAVAERALAAAEQRAGGSAAIAGAGQARARAEAALQTAERALMETNNSAASAQVSINQQLAVRYTQWAGCDPSRIMGTVASLLTIKDPRHAFPLEIAAGSKLRHVVVDNEITATQLVKLGNLQTRTTMVPLTRIRPRSLTPQQIAKAHAIVGNAARPAMDLVSFAPAMRPAVEYAIGNVFICDDSRTAEAVSNNREIYARCITLQGDLFDPSGTLSGGSAPSNAGVLCQLARAQVLAAEAKEHSAAVAAAQAELAKLDAAEHAGGEVARAARACDGIRERLSQTRFAELSAQANALVAEIGDLNARVASLDGERSRHQVKVKDLEKTIKALETGSAATQKALERDLAALQKNIPKLEAAAKEAADAAARVDAAADGYRADMARHRALIESCEAAIAKSTEEAAQLAERLVDEEAAVADASAQVEAATAEIRSSEAALQKLKNELSDVKSELSQHELHVRALIKMKKDLKDARGEYTRALEKLIRTHRFITADKARFGESGGDYDFAAHDVAARRAELDRMKAQQVKLQGSVNKKVMALFEKAEAEYTDLVKKRDIIVADKVKIEATIADLDQRKLEALELTWGKVNESFGMIFSTLLPGASCRLDKHVARAAGIDANEITGVEMRVAFGGVWKASLAELSGGQRSLLALSLILAMLKFSPAPLYILDEVDAALDLSHTQNIGVMLKEQFPQAQFIVVSLKEGMFNNANVLFRTKFVDGVSTVTRIANKRG